MKGFGKRGYNVNQKGVIVEPLLWFAQEIEQCDAQGYLYQEDYYHGADEFFDFEAFGKLLAQTLSRIEPMEQRTACGLRYALFAERSDRFPIPYDRLGIDPRHFYEAGKEQLHDLRFYDYVRDTLSLDEKLSYLSRFPHEKAAERIIEAYLAHGDTRTASQMLRSWLDEAFDIRYADRLIRMQEASPQSVCDFLRSALDQNGYDAKEFVFRYLEQCPHAQTVLDRMKTARPYWYYDYMQQQNNIEQMHAVLPKVPSKKDAFYMNYYKEYPEEATEYFRARINELLPYTGNRYYEEIITYMKPLKTLTTEAYFHGLLGRLRSQFKRRRNFMKLLDQHFPNRLFEG